MNNKISLEAGLWKRRLKQSNLLKKELEAAKEEEEEMRGILLERTWFRAIPKPHTS
jgi:hypothetical protein